MNNLPEHTAQHQEFDRATQHISSHIANKDNENIEQKPHIIDKINFASINVDNINNIKSERKKKKKKTNRCVICNKKVGILGFKCKCSEEHLFCSAHRLPESHKCTFDHRLEEKNMLANKLVKVVSDKIQKI